MDLTSIWRKAQHNTGLSQKEMAYGAHMSKSAINNYLNHGNTPDGAAIDLARSFDDYETRMAVASQLLEIWRLFDGKKFRHDPSAIDAFAEFEEEERDLAYKNDQVRKLLATDELDQQAIKQLIDFQYQEMDALLMRMTEFNAISLRTGITPMEMFKRRIHYYVKEGYIKEV